MARKEIKVSLKFEQYDWAPGLPALKFKRDVLGYGAGIVNEYGVGDSLADCANRVDMGQAAVAAPGPWWQMPGETAVRRTSWPPEPTTDEATTDEAAARSQDAQEARSQQLQAAVLNLNGCIEAVADGARSLPRSK